LSWEDVELVGGGTGVWQRSVEPREGVPGESVELEKPWQWQRLWLWMAWKDIWMDGLLVLDGKELELLGWIGWRHDEGESNEEEVEESAGREGRSGGEEEQQ